MQEQVSTSRPTPLAGPAATIVVLLSMATMAAAIPGGPTGCALPAEGRPAAAEGTSVREIAAAVVAAAARDWLGVDRLDTALPAPVARVADEFERIDLPLDIAGVVSVPGRDLDEHLLDLPPPVC